LKAIILAAGEGKRLRPLTENVPKCMVKLFGKSLLEYQIEVFKKCGIDDIIVIRGYKGQTINFEGINYYENKNFDSTNMIETLFCAKSEFTDSLIISYGDIIFEKRILDSIIKEETDMAVIIDKGWKEYWKLRFANPLDDAESLKINSNGYILDIGQKVSNISEIDGQYIGLMKFPKSTLKNIIDFYNDCANKSKISINPLNKLLPFEKSYMTDFIRGLINIGYKVKGIEIDNGWLELDTISDYNLYNNLFLKNNLKPFFKIL
jgi:L-glutamine-phosphate cytidylyltransferase